MFDKPVKIVSKDLRESAKGEHCALRIEGVCNGRIATTVLAHLNSRYKGTGNKSPDVMAVFACSDCHAHLDAGRVLAEDKLRAWQETIMKWIKKGLVVVK